MKRTLAVVATVLVAALAPASVCAAPKAATPDDARTAEAKAHYKRGATFYKEARYREAIDEFMAAYRVKPSGVLQYNIGQAYEKLGDIPSALASYNNYLREEPSAPNRETVLRAISNLERRLAAGGVQMLYVFTDPPDAEVWVDGQSRGRSPFYAALLQGAHAISVMKSGYRTEQRSVMLSAERSLSMTLPLQPEPIALAPPVAAGVAGGAGAGAIASAPAAPAPHAAPPEATKPVPAPQPVERKNWLGPIIAGSAAVVAAGAGAWMGVQARNAQNSLLHGLPANRSTADSLAQKAKNDATAANVLYGVAGAAALTGGGFLVFGGYF